MKYNLGDGLAGKVYPLDVHCCASVSREVISLAVISLPTVILWEYVGCTNSAVSVCFPESIICRCMLLALTVLPGGV